MIPKCIATTSFSLDFQLLWTLDTETSLTFFFVVKPVQDHVCRVGQVSIRFCKDDFWLQSLAVAHILVLSS